MIRMATLLTGSIAALFLVAGAVSQAEARRGGGGHHGGGGGFHGGGMHGGGGHAFRGGGGRHMGHHGGGGRHFHGGGGNRHVHGGGGHRYGHNHRHRHGRWVNGVWVAWPGAYYGYSGGGCGYAYRMWQNTGSSYWRRRYYDCAG